MASNISELKKTPFIPNEILLGFYSKMCTLFFWLLLKKKKSVEDTTRKKADVLSNGSVMVLFFLDNDWLW